MQDDGASVDVGYERQHLHMAIRSLPKLEYVVILLFYMEEKSVKEIEIITGMPSGTIRSHLSRARVHLRQYMEKMV